MKKNTNTKQNASKGKRTEQRETFAFYIGIDLGDKNSDVCVLNPAGEVHKEFRIRMNAAALDAYFAGIGQSRVAIEVGGQSQWVAELVHFKPRLLHPPSSQPGTASGSDVDSSQGSSSSR